MPIAAAWIRPACGTVLWSRRTTRDIGGIDGKEVPEGSSFCLGRWIWPGSRSSPRGFDSCGDDRVEWNLPGTTTGYTITVTGDDGGPRNIFPATSSDNGVWTWAGPSPNFPEFLSFGEAETLTVTFDSAVPIDDFVFGVSSTSASTGQLTLVGGSAGLGDFDLTDSLQAFRRSGARHSRSFFGRLRHSLAQARLSAQEDPVTDRRADSQTTR